MNQITAIFLGPQGSGKGTQVKLLEEFLQTRDPERGPVHLDMGKGLRALGEECGYTTELLKESLDRGELQPLFLTGYVMAHTLIHGMKGHEHLLIDGFPRTSEQIDIFESAMRFYQRKNRYVLYVRISDEEAVKRLLKRGRSDDTEEVIRKRLAWYHEQVEPTIHTLRDNQDYRFLDIDGERSIEEIHQDILRQLALA